MSDPVRVVITGAPGAGKSTLLAELTRRGITTVPEAARIILRQPHGMALRADDPRGFARAMLDADLDAFDRVKTGLTVHDRGFPDIAGFLHLEGLRADRALEQACRDLRYAAVFRAPPWRDIYLGDAQRIQTWDEAVASDAAVTAAWRAYGYEPIDLPKVDTAARADFLLGRLAI